MDLPRTPPSLFPHQREAVDVLTKCLTQSARVTAVMACGTGKTRVGAEVAGRIAKTGSGHRLVVVPTLELVRQTVSEWANQFGRDRLGRVVAVCSDREVLAAHRSGLQGELTDSDVQVANDAAGLSDLAQAPGALTVACTYSSLRTLAEAQGRHQMPPPDIAVIDEAHRTAGPRGKAWADIHYDDVITARRRLYLTATPRIIDSAGDGVISMADEHLYGQVAYRLTFATATDQGLLARCRLVAPAVDISEAQQLLNRDDAFLRVGDPDVAASLLAHQLAVLRAAHEHGVRRLITYHGTIAEAQWFADLLPRAHALLPADQRPIALAAEHVHGRQTVAERRRVLNRLAGQEDGLVVVSNARVLSEGVDVPAVDAVCFLSPRGPIDTIQATGRAMRLLDRSTPKTATIMVPVARRPDQDPETAVLSTPFGSIWRTVQALSSHDETLHRQLRTARRSFATPIRRGFRPWSLPGESPTPEPAGPAHELLLLHERAGLHTGHISELYEASVDAVEAQFGRMGVKPLRGTAPDGWRTAPATMAQLYRCGLTISRVGELCGRSYGTVHYWLRKLGVTLRGRGPSTAHAPETEQLAAWYSSGLSLAKVGDLAGINRGTVRSRVVAHGTAIRPRSARPERKRPLTPADLRMARLYNSGLSIDSVAAMESRSFTFVRNRLIAAGVTFRSPNATAAGRAGRRAVRLIRPQTPMPASVAVVLRERGLKTSHVAQLTGRSDEYVRKQLAIVGVPVRSTEDRLGIDVALLERVYRLTGSRRATAQIFHVNPGTVIARLREAGAWIQPQGYSRPDPDAEPVRIAEPTPWEVRDHEILARRAAGQTTAGIARYLRTSLREIHEVLRVYERYDRRTALILRRHSHGEHPGVIAVRLGIRPASVLEPLAQVGR
ncbi:DEAD/DEAH box helicase family protein [Streptomyces sp. NBC_00838]|uniref:DEAD/DEAH box helicase family protein n=1 Tax=Streptomyces sp. NBC_00838 TaxID=2903680 RepID=UPI00386B95B4|nr:DEAD/DEAH box helicase family protein [Streptomyces sp. NBC_00838]